ncbi:hypothetical protein G6514_004736 [Epicoccum nigrum]|nr:hypothetical protein G6514_004736 [Epicoccum nigrum]
MSLYVTDEGQSQFGQELLSTFGALVGEVALVPATGGVFQVELTHIPKSTNDASDASDAQVRKTLLWDRKTQGGFPETKVLKQLVRDQIDPERDLGHSDVGGKKKAAVPQAADEVKVDEVEVDGVRVNGRKEKAAESMVGDVEAEGVHEMMDGKRDADGGVCEDCK